MKIHAYGTVGEAGTGGDFGAGHAFDEAKDQGFAVGVGERADGVEDGVGFGAGVRGMTSGRNALFRLGGSGFLVEFFVGFEAAMKIVGAVASDGGQPSGEAGDFAQIGEASQGLEEDVLHEVVDVGEGNASEENAVDHAGVAGVEQAECGTVATLGGANEGVVWAAEFVRKIHDRWTAARRAEFRECGHVGSMEIRSVSSGRRRKTVEC
jgi:hypothetical protein